MKRTIATVVAALTALLLLAGCPQPESCGRKDHSRVVTKGGHTTTQHCRNGVWT